MTLYEMSASYRDSAERLQLRILRLREAQADCPTEEEALALALRIRRLKPLLRQCRELAALTEHYYERSYQRHDPYRI